MRTVNIEVGGMLSTLSALGVQKQLARLPGVKKAAGSQFGLAWLTLKAPPADSQFPSDRRRTATEDSVTMPLPASDAVPEMPGSPKTTEEEGSVTYEEGMPVSKVNETVEYTVE